VGLLGDLELPKLLVHRRHPPIRVAHQDEDPDRAELVHTPGRCPRLAIAAGPRALLHPREGAARRADDRIVLYLGAATYDQRTADPFAAAFGSDLARGYEPSSYVRASLALGDPLRWTVEREGADGTWVVVP